VLRVREGRSEAILHVTGGRTGTRVAGGDSSGADATLALDVSTLLAVATGRLPLPRAVKSGAVEATGDPAALGDFAALFDAG
jgi:alkyl sulfatase BDS1-like metallo-beta-lactamase superfamily hydrolase